VLFTVTLSASVWETSSTVLLNVVSFRISAPFSAIVFSISARDWIWTCGKDQHPIGHEHLGDVPPLALVPSSHQLFDRPIRRWCRLFRRRNTFIERFTSLGTSGWKFRGIGFFISLLTQMTHGDQRHQSDNYCQNSKDRPRCGWESSFLCIHVVFMRV